MAGQHKTEQLQIRLSPEQKSRIRQSARQAGMGMSAWILERLHPRKARKFQSLVRDLSKGDDQKLALAAINDFLSSLRPGEYPDAVAELPRVRLAPLASNQLAAMTEQAAMNLGHAPPGWTERIEALDEPWFATRLLSLRLYLLTVSPPAFRRRNVFVDATLGDRV